jgi:hypothetical protein
MLPVMLVDGMAAGTAVLMFPLGMVAVALNVAVIPKNVIEQSLIWSVSELRTLSVRVTTVALEQLMVVVLPVTITPVTPL